MGLHDDVSVDGGERAAARMRAAGADDGPMSSSERVHSVRRRRSVAGVLRCSVPAGWLRRLVPVSRMAADIERPRPNYAGTATSARGHNASSEMLAIANAPNDYLARNERYVDRERQFIATSSATTAMPMAR